MKQVFNFIILVFIVAVLGMVTLFSFGIFKGSLEAMDALERIQIRQMNRNDEKNKFLKQCSKNYKKSDCEDIWYTN